ncbi:MAG: hypothetical protein PHC54_06560 [Candidatus Omnitrophica bacterium]|nr:hypothetical protein [Candidatus Omnitrophota bacterium]MDD5592819.1 hypothetical protein [Candidatus Omnitrophota bacterium]
MDFKEARKEINSINFDTLRTDDKDYLEAVLVKEEIDKLKERLKKIFGDPQAEISPKMEDTVKGFGGIMRGQTLYFWNEGQSALFAMLWPWQDGSHTTLKMGRKKIA